MTQCNIEHNTVPPCQMQSRNQNLYFGSLTRIANLHKRPFTIRGAPRKIWATGDFVVGRYVGSPECKDVVDYLELSDGSLRPLKLNDLVVGAFGVREATQECVGTWQMIGEGSHPIMVDICGSGMFGQVTSRSSRHHLPAKFEYQGHCYRRNKKTCMKDFAPMKQVVEWPHCPIILIVGTSMSCGKTVTSKVVLEIVKKDLGFQKVAGVKFTGAGYNHDIKQMSGAGADFVCDFVDAGYPSTVMLPGEYRETALPAMLGLLTRQNPDCIVAELGASPLEPYNGVEVLKELLESHPCPSQVFTVLCASDAYAVSGLRQALVSEGMIQFQPDIVCGIAANNAAAVALVKRVSGSSAYNLTDPASVVEVRKLLERRLFD